ncbi:MAG: S8 family serine peptidase, partial [Oscillospiraceae bacterium]|nr:S8 family serine peptidase [Oscillospiraceae bacterium]
MKHRILSRARSLTAAAAMMCSVISSSGVLQSAAAQIPPEQKTASSVSQQKSNEPVTVIVKVTGDAVMAQPEAVEMGSDYLETDEAMQLTAQYKAVQEAVQERIRAFYPDLQVGFSYSALYNGFSCELPENLIEQVEALPDVVCVTVMKDIAVPQMNQAAALSGFPAYYDYTGCSGEGQVIAVIDSELDYTHPMFAPLADDIETAVSKEDVAKVISSGILNRDVDPDRAYISSKLPYVVNYADPDDPYGGISNDLQYHGTHVSGIAAGNTFKTSDGTELSGIARDAQLMFFCVSTPRGYIDGDAGLAAIEDAVKLHADVINMSWGSDATEYWGNNPFSDAVSAADRAGVIVCNSAGNADNGTYYYGRTTIPENPDTGMISDKAELGSPIMMVASAENAGVAQGDAFLLGERQIGLIPMMDEIGGLFYLSDSLTPGEYEYVDCQNGTERDFLRAGDLSGRIALVQRAEVSPTAITAKAKAAGASGVILIDQKHPDGMNYIFSTTTSIVINGISWLDGQAMLAAENKTLTITSEPIEREYVSSVSSYTSWGVKASLDLRPDIMGIGGRVRSAAYDGGDYTASGTSMASPYVTGCTAVLRQYLKKLGVELTGSDFAAYVRRLLMNTAVPYEDGGNFVTPRRQGAGLVSLDRAMAAKVLMTGAAGDAKVNLFDKLGDTFSFDLTLTNYSDEAVTYPQAEIRLTTDGTYYDPELELDRTAGQQKLNCTSDFTGPVTIAAGETKTVTVSISLDAAQCRKLEELFKYGFFAEGYILLSGAENSADISIPMLGYHGDWAQIPCSDPETDTVKIMFGSDHDSVPLSVVRTSLLYKQILERVPEEEIYEVIEEPFKAFWFDCDYATKEEKKQLASNAMECWISPNRDSIADAVTGFRYENQRRNTSRSNAQLLDADGNVLYDGAPGAVANNCEFEKLEEGDYTYMKKSWI